MQRVRLQRLARILPGGMAEGPCARHVNRERNEEHHNCRYARPDVHAAEKQPVKRFVNDVQGSQRQQARLHERGEVFKLPVSVGMGLVCRPIGNSNGKKSDNRGNQIQPGVQRLGQHAEAPRFDNQERFQRNQQGRRTHAQKRGPLLLPRFLDWRHYFHRGSRLPQIVRFSVPGKRRSAGPLKVRLFRRRHGWRRQQRQSLGFAAFAAHFHLVKEERWRNHRSRQADLR